MKKLLIVILLSLGFIGSINAESLIDESLAMAKQGEFNRAKDLIEEIANNGNSEAQYILSMYYRDPSALNIPEIGEKWLFIAAENDNADAQYDIGWRLAAGWKDDSIEDIIQMIYWFEKAGFNGHTDAYANLGVLYENEDRDTLAEMEVAANNGNAMAQFNLGWINARGLLSSKGLMQDEKVAKSWFEKAAKLGFKDAIEILEKNF
jgi:hypothetical protein